MRFSREDGLTVIAAVAPIPSRSPQRSFVRSPASDLDAVDALVYYLNAAALLVSREQIEQSRLHTGLIIDRLEKALSACDALASAISDDEGQPLNELIELGIFGLSEHEHTIRSLDQIDTFVRRLQDAKRCAKQGLGRRRGAKPGAGRPRDRVFTNLVSRLAQIYETAWQKKATVTRSDYRGGQPSGPFLRFARTTLAHLGLDRTDEAVASALAAQRKREKASRPS